MHEKYVAFLSAVKGQTVSELITETAVPKRTALYRLRQLEQDGYIERETEQNQQIRNRRVYLTKKGQAALGARGINLLSFKVSSGKKGWKKYQVQPQVQHSLIPNTSYGKSVFVKEPYKSTDTTANNVLIDRKVAPRTLTVDEALRARGVDPTRITEEVKERLADAVGLEYEKSFPGHAYFFAHTPT